MREECVATGVVEDHDDGSSSTHGGSVCIRLRDNDLYIVPEQDIVWNCRSSLWIVLPSSKGLYRSSSPGSCGVCGSSVGCFGLGLDINICGGCGAHETAGGRQKP